MKSKEEEGDLSYDRVEREYKEYLIDREYKMFLKEWKYYKSIEAHIDEPLSKTEFVIKLIDAEIDVVWGRQSNEG